LSFFFSSRRRHTRCYRDWSSDVCSSDLLSLGAAAIALLPLAAMADDQATIAQGGAFKWGPAPPSAPKGAQLAVLYGDPTKEGPRSEERRVGKEGRARW